MARDPLDTIVHVHRARMRKALVAAFGSDRVDMVASIVGGASGAFPFRIDIDHRQYLVRLEGPASPLRNPYQYESMRIASAAGIAPCVHHVDETDRVAVMDFVKERPLSTFPGGPPALAGAIGKLLGGVQETPSFPRFLAYPEMVGRLWAWVCGTGLFAPGVLDPCTKR